MRGERTISRRGFLAGWAAAVLAPGSARSAAGEDALNFEAVGDWGMAKAASGVASAMADWAASHPLRAIVSTGDNFYPQGVASVTDPLWSQRYESVFGAASLSCPWYPVLGNHDHRGNIDAQLAYSQIDPRWQMAGRYYSRSEPLPDGGTMDFFFIDTTPILDANRRFAGSLLPVGHFVREQFAWLEGALASSKGRWKVVVGHHPVFSGGQHGSTPVLIENLKPTLDRNGVHLYINGHEHDLQHVAVDGIHYLTSGSCSEARSTGSTQGTVFSAATTGFLTARATGREIAISFVSGRRETLHSFIVDGASTDRN